MVVLGAVTDPDAPRSGLKAKPSQRPARPAAHGPSTRGVGPGRPSPPQSLDSRPCALAGGAGDVGSDATNAGKGRAEQTARRLRFSSASSVASGGLREV